MTRCELKLIAAATEKMKRLANVAGHDPEADHSKADDILLDLMVDLGHKGIVDHFNRIKKWYA